MVLLLILLSIIKNEASLPKEACSDFKAIFADFLIGVKQASPQRHQHRV